MRFLANENFPLDAVEALRENKVILRDKIKSIDME
jgi:hypothetical protein